MSEELPRYFGGSSVFSSEVRALKATDFKQLVSRYFLNPVNHSLTRKEYRQLDEEERKKSKDCGYVCPCSFNSDPCRRANENAVELSLACIDIDGGAIARKIHEDPSVVLDALHGVNLVTYRTISHTDEDPRYRIIVELPPGVKPDGYERVLDFIAHHRLGMPDDWEGATESHVVSQAMFRPVCFKDENYTALVGYRVEGIPLPVELIPALEEEEAEEFINGRTFSMGEANEDILGLAYMPKAGLTPEDLRGALFALDPDMAYPQWVEIIRACRHQFRGEEEAREIFEMLVEWSAGGTKYGGEAEVWRKWKSFRPDPKGRAPTTVKTIFHYALAAGWNSTKLAKKLKGGVEEWIAAQDDKEELIREGPVKIAELPFRNEVVEDELLIMIKARIKELTGNNVSKLSLLHELNKARKRLAAGKAKEREGDHVPTWLHGFVYISTGDKFRHTGTGDYYTIGAFDRTYGRELMPADPADMPANGIPPILPSNYALNTIKIPTVADTIYYPLNHGADQFVVIEGKTYLNIYNPLSPPDATPENWREALALYKELLHALYGNPLYELLMLDWHASQVQFPGLKILWAPLTQSVEGAGKGMMSDIMRATLGQINVRETPPEVVNDKYNDHYVLGVVVNIWNEIHIPGERRARVTNALKSPITDEFVTVIQKYRDAREVLNLVNHMAFTNAPDAIHLDPGDRRWSIFYSPIQTKEHAAELAAEGFYKRLEILKGAWAGSLRYALQQHKISPDFPYKGPAPITEFRQALIEEGINPVQVAIQDLVDDEHEPLISADLVSTAHLNQSLSTETKRQGTKPAHYLQRMGYVKWRGKIRPTVGGLRTDIWVHPGRFIDGIESPVETLDRRVAQNGNLISI